MKALHFPRVSASGRALLAVLLTAPAAQAADYTWLGTSGTNYAAVANWAPETPAGPPGVNDTATFNDTATTTAGIYGATNRSAQAFIFAATKHYSFVIPRDDRFYTLGSALTQNGSGSVTFDAPLRFGSGAVINGSGSGDVILDGVLGGDNALQIASGGSFRVFVNGTQTVGAGTNQLTTAASALGGVGVLSRQLAVTAAGATVTPGTPGAAGTLTLAGGFSSALATQFEFDFGGAGGSQDRLLLTGGTFHLGDPGEGGFALHLRDLGLDAAAAGTPLTLIETTGAVTLDFAAFNPDAFSIASLPTGWVLDLAYGNDGLLFDTLTGNLTVQFAVVPEPAGGALLAILGGGLLLARWRKRQA